MVAVSVIVPVWNRADLTNSFLYKNWLLYQTKSNIEFIIVNNGSTDNTDKVLKTWQDRMGDRLIVPTALKNLGFSGGNNWGASFAQGDILIFTSNDVVSTDDYITRVQEIVALKSFALYGAELLEHDTGWNKFNNRIIPYLAGHFIAVHKSIWKELEWDERYFPCDYEDIDLSMQASLQKLRLIPLNLPIQHASGQSAQHIEGGRLAITLKNKAKFMEKWGLS